MRWSTTSSSPAWRICASPAPASPGASPWTLTRATWSMCGWTPCSTTPPPWASATTSTTTTSSYWPADVHIVGKEIVRFHSIIWPAMLMSMEMPLPKHVYGHGWLLLDGGKMSKSKGNVVDPYVLAEQFGVDALRFFLLRTFPFGTDGNFSNELLIQHHQHRPGQRPGQPGQPHHRHGGASTSAAPCPTAAGQDSPSRWTELKDLATALPGPLSGGDGSASQLHNGPGGDFQGHPPGQQVYRRERPLGAGQGLEANGGPPGPRCFITSWRPCASAPSCSPPLCPPAATRSSTRSAPARAAAPGRAPRPGAT